MSRNPRQSNQLSQDHLIMNVLKKTEINYARLLCFACCKSLGIGKPALEAESNEVKR